MENILKLMSYLPSNEIIKIFMCIISILAIFNAIIFKIFQILEKWRKKRNKQEEVTKIVEGISEIKNDLNIIAEGLKTVLANNLNQRCKEYIKLEYIPEDEFDEFMKEHAAYNKLNGNSTIDAKVENVLKNISVKSVE